MAEFLKQYQGFMQQAQGELQRLVKQRSEIDQQIGELEQILGSAKPMKGKKRGPKPKLNAAKDKALGGWISSGKKAIPSDKKEWANAVAYAIKQHKDGAAKKDIEAMMRRKLPDGWQKAMQKHSGEKLKMVGMRSTAKYFVK